MKIKKSFVLIPLISTIPLVFISCAKSTNSSNEILSLSKLKSWIASDYVIVKLKPKNDLIESKEVKINEFSNNENYEPYLEINLKKINQGIDINSESNKKFKEEIESTIRKTNIKIDHYYIPIQNDDANSKIFFEISIDSNSLIINVPFINLATNNKFKIQNLSEEELIKDIDNKFWSTDSIISNLNHYVSEIVNENVINEIKILNEKINNLENAKKQVINNLFINKNVDSIIINQLKTIKYFSNSENDYKNMYIDFNRQLKPEKEFKKDNWLYFLNLKIWTSKINTYFFEVSVPLVINIENL